jgi:valyl-tRNA synthetase
VGEDGFVVVATTRPETMLGDEAVAVNPNDTRYENLHGKKVMLPLVNKPIPIIVDELVDPKFGTGCVKVTPAHDPADYEMALRHHLPLTVVIAPDGSMTATAGEAFAGLDRMEGAQSRGGKTRSAGPGAQGGKICSSRRLQRAQPRSHRALFERAMVFALSVAWWKATAAVETGQIKFHPERWSKTYLHWMVNIKDWCISRQLWWGHRVPVWYQGTAKRAVKSNLPGDGWHAGPRCA